MSDADENSLKVIRWMNLMAATPQALVAKQEKIVNKGMISLADLKELGPLMIQMGQRLDEDLDDLKLLDCDLRFYDIQNLPENRWLLNEYIKNCYCAYSEISGKGVFASRNIKAGELITLYPANAIKKEIRKGFYRYLQRLAPGSEPIDKMGELEIKALHPYRTNITENIFIIGDPKRTNEPGFLGHMINDPIYNNKITKEEYTQNIFKANAAPVIVKKCGVVIIASKDIKKTEEIGIAYGWPYWEDFREPISSKFTLKSHTSDNGLIILDAKNES